MDSASALPEPGAFGRGLAHRMTPQVTVIRRAVVQPGFIARRSIAFGSYVGQSQVSRWSIGATMGRGALAVRPPIDYWPWASAEEPEPVAVPRLDRALPRAKLLRRSGQPDPGAIVKAMRPEPIDLATRGQAKAPKRNDMQSFKAMLERTGRLPASDDDGPATDDRGRGTVAVPPGRDRAATPTRPSTPTRAAAPAATPRATTPTTAANPRATRTAPTPAPAAASPMSAGRPAPTPSRAQRPNPFDRDDEPGPTLRRTPERAATPAPAAAPSAFGSPVSDGAADAPGTTLDLPVSPVWPGAIESSAATATPPTISARRAAEQLRSARGPRPLPEVISPSVEQVAPRRWSSTDTVDAGELAQQLIARRTQTTSPSTSATGPATPAAAPTTAHAAAPPSADDHVDAATAVVAPAGVQRVTATSTDDGHAAVVRRSTVDAPAATSPQDSQPTPGAPRAASGVDITNTPASAAAAPIRREATPMQVAPSPPIAPPALLVQRSSPVGPSLLLPAGEAAAAPRTDGRERARQLPTAIASTPPIAAETGSATAATRAAATFTDRTQRMLARTLSPQPPDLTMPAPPQAAEHPDDVRLDAVRPAAVRPDAVRPDAVRPDAVRPAVVAPQATAPPVDAASASPAAAATAAPAERTVRRSPLPDRPTTEARIVDPAPATGQAATVARPADIARSERPAPPARPTPNRFLQVLHATPAPAPRRLPTRFTPLARSIAGDAPVQLRHDEGARAALAAVGKRAATIGNTILLDAAPTSAAATTVLAHELTHVANPTMAPRFYDDERQTVEERRADAVAQLIQRSPSLLVAPPAGAPLGSTSQSLQAAANAAGNAAAQRATSTPATPGTMVRRSVDTTLPPPPPQRATALASAPPAVRPMAPSSAPSARSTSGTTSTGSASRAATVRRSTSSHSSRSSAATPGNGGAVRRATAGSSAGAGGTGNDASTIRRAVTDNAGGAADADITGNSLQDDNSLPPMIEAMKTTGGQLDFVDWIVEQVEDRVVAEFQRRGGRFREDF